MVHFLITYRTPELQWSRCVSTPETAKLTSSSIPEYELQWSRCVSTPETIAFAEACLSDERASMEPVCFNTGNLVGSIPSWERWGCFNGAGVFQHRKLDEARKGFIADQVLQWSRCVSTPETTQTQSAPQPAANASMEPVCFNTGNVL